MEYQFSFSTLSTALGNRFAIPTFQQLRRAEEQCKAEGRLHTFPQFDDAPIQKQESTRLVNVPDDNYQLFFAEAIRREF